MTSKIWNTIENISISLIMLLAINFVIIKPMRKEMREQFKIVAEIAAQPKYSISNDFEKMRTKKNGSITLDLNNQLNTLELEIRSQDSVEIEQNSIFQKLRFWNKLKHD